MTSDLQSARRLRTLHSMLWSAWGDVVGFPAELVSEKQYKNRLSGRPRGSAIPWSKIIGGKFGVSIELPAGAYSDDTQLRLATARAIRHSGEFDVEVFSKIELTVWLSYALGAGRGSKAAATSLGSPNIAWFSNFFDNKYSRYLDGGGNGAAMRIQPHVWACRDLTDPSSYLRDVVRNSVSTHGHCRGILGAMIHAEHLAHAMLHGALPDADDWTRAGDRCGDALIQIVDSDSELRDFWLPTWEKLAHVKLKSAVSETVEEWKLLASAAADMGRSSLNATQKYEELVTQVGGLDPSTRGSGLLAAILSIAGSSWLEQEGSEGAIEKIATLIGSDTDSIASMAGALIGACSNLAPVGIIQDEKYLGEVADRLYRISARRQVDDFIYPDLLYWQAPRTALDAVTIKGSAATLAGIGRMESVGKEVSLPRGAGSYRWFSTWFGQRVLCKYRSTNSAGEVRQHDGKKGAGTIDAELAAGLFDKVDIPGNDKIHVSIDSMIQKVSKSGFDPEEVGKAVIELAGTDKPIENVVGFAAALVSLLSTESDG